MRRVGVHVDGCEVHIEAKRGRGRLRDGGALKEIMCLFPVKGWGRRGQSVYTLGEFWVPKIHERQDGVRKDRLQERVRS